jgi:hypothetical protein
MISTVHQLLHDSHPLQPHPALQRAQLPVWKLAISARLESLQHLLGLHIRPSPPDHGVRRQRSARLAACSYSWWWWIL